MTKLLRFQVDCMRAFAEGTLPPPPPSGVDFTMPKQSARDMFARQTMDAEPFDPSVFKSDVVKEEYEGLCRDHRQLIKMGENFGTFDPLGKLAFLDQLEAIEGRWDIFFGRLGLTGDLNPEYKEQSEQFLKGMGLGASQFREVLRGAHAAMRRDAE